MSDLTSNITSAIAGNAAVTAWCQSKYKLNQTVFLGIDFDQLPADDHYPLCIVMPVGSKDGRGREKPEATYVVTCGIADDTGASTSGKIVKFAQIVDLEAFRQLVLAAIEAADLCGGYVEEVETENDPVEMFPLFSTNMIVKISFLAPMRGRWSV